MMKSSKNPTDSQNEHKSESKTETLDFENALLELNKIVDCMSQNKMGLAESLNEYERAVMLIKNCQTQLDDAKQKISILRKQEEEGSYALDSLK